MAWLDGGTAVFAFRGTESVKDALADLNAVPVDIDWMLHAFPEVRGHSGARFGTFFGMFRDVFHCFFVRSSCVSLFRFTFSVC